ncbi:MAG: HAD-IA family hydrolase [Paracoccus sp. (in: a-proteobacteria)]|nr:HAD-IA family hydrolase [Paracoccus sp. (in: a-proteobacteria)]
MKLVIFDVDGTLVDSQALICGAMGDAMTGAGLPVLPRSDVLSIVGLSLPVAVARLLPGEAPSRHEAVVEGYRASFLRRRTRDEAPLYPGAIECLDALDARGDLLLGIATGKSRRGLDALIAAHGLKGRFVTIQTADLNPSKPDPGMVNAALSETGTAPQDALMIGDTVFDMEMARAAGVAAIGVAWGYHDAAALRACGAEVAEDFPSLTEMIAGWAK